MMQVQTIKIKDLQPYAKNPRQNKAAIEYVVKSIDEFGFLVPLVIDKDNTIVAGHTRYAAAKKLGMAEVPCVVASDLTPSQIKAFRLVDNKSSEFAKWDLSMLIEELNAIPLSIDMKKFSFDIQTDFAGFQSDEPKGTQSTPDDNEGEQLPYGFARERTADNYLLREFDEYRCDGFYQMPILEAVDHVPSRLIGFNYMLSSDEYDAGIHFYIDDYQFERIWNDPHKYMERLALFDCVLSPDFSLYMDMPMAMKVWNIYRSRMVGQIMQDYGITVIPTLSWAEEETFSFCFDGIEPGGTVSVSTIGVKQEKGAMKIWIAGMDEAMKRIRPSAVVVYGGEIDYDFKGTQAIYIRNEMLERWKARGMQDD